MARPLFHAHQITPDKTKWTVLVQVYERRKPKKSDGGPLYRNYMVTDTLGTKVPIVMFDGNVAFFSNTLQPFKRYYISNAPVKVTPPAYRIVEYENTWTLHRRILVEPHEETIPPPLPCTFSFDLFSNMYRFADQGRSVCIKALVIHTLPLQQTDESSSVRDFVVINDEFIPMLLRVWDDLLVESDVNVHTRYKVPTLIIAYGLKVTTHNGLSLGTKTNAYFLHNPPLNEEHPLKDWYTAHATQVAVLLEDRAYRATSKLFHPPTNLEIMPLNHALASIGNVKTLWTEGKLTYLPGQDKLWFEACEKCFRPLDVDADWKIWCSDCQEHTNVVVRGTVAVFLSQGTHVIEATIKSPDFERLIPFTPNDISLAAKQGVSLTDQIEDALKKKHVICFLKFYDRRSRGETIRRYPIVKVYTQDEVQTYQQATERIEDTQPILQQTSHAALTTDTAMTHIGSSSSAPLQTVDREFFTPSTKAVLDELSQPSLHDQVAPNQSYPTKRMLLFEESQPGEDLDSITTQHTTCKSPVQATTLQENEPSTDTLQTTPSKKHKASAKEV